MIEFGYEVLFAWKEEVRMKGEVVVESSVECVMVQPVRVVDLGVPVAQTVVAVVAAAHAQPFDPIDVENVDVAVAFAGMV
jgi:hypothetical protein